LWRNTDLSGNIEELSGTVQCILDACLKRIVLSFNVSLFGKSFLLIWRKIV
jgi:hypothetical protein